MDERVKEVVKELNHPVYTVEFLEEWITRNDNAFINAPAALQAMGAKGYYQAAKQMARKIQNEEELQEYRCKKCENYQPYEPDAGLYEGCEAQELYTDENSDEIIEAVDKAIIAFMSQRGINCPYFKERGKGTI